MSSIPFSPPTHRDDQLIISGSRFLKVLSKRPRFYVGLHLDPIGYIPVCTVPFGLAGRWPDFSMASKAFHFATLAYCSSHYNREHNELTSTYLGQCRYYLNQAIGENSVMEVFVASYATLMSSLQIERRLLETLHYTEGLCIAASVLILRRREPQCDRETFVIVNKFLLSGLDALRLAYFVARDPLGTEDVVNLARKMHSGLRLVCSWHCLLSPLGTNPLLQVMKLNLYSAFYIDYYFSVIQYSETDDEIAQAKASLQEILSSIIDLAPRISRTWSLFSAVMDETRNWPWLSDRLLMDGIAKDQFDYETSKTGLLFALAKVIEAIIGEPDITVNDIYAHVHPAIFLCRLYALQLSQSRQRWQFRGAARYLFWAGIALRGADDAGDQSQAR
jgi:hypothetical protein